MQTLIALLDAGTDLGPAQVEQAVQALVSSEVSDGEKMEFLKALRTKGETASELAAFARALTTRAVQPVLDPQTLPGPLLDVCGTGGDKQGYFNISTGVMFIAAAAGACVVKHGNRAITSKSGTADVLEELGVPLETSPAELRASLETHGIAFIFAPAYHPAFKTIGPIRKSLAAQGIPTIFNMLGPLLNPARPPFQLVGLFSAGLLEKYAAALQSLGCESAWAVHGDGTDELSLTGPSDVCAVSQKEIRKFTLDAQTYGLPRCGPEALRGGDRSENARILFGILDGSEHGPRREILLLNAAAALVVCKLAADLPEGLARAREALDSKAALEKLNALRRS